MSTQSTNSVTTIPAARSRRRAALAVATVLAGGVLLQHTAHAQDASQLSAIQAQISHLQAQLKQLQREAASRDAALKQAQSDAATARADASAAITRTASYAAAAHGAPLSSPPGYYPQGPATGSGFNIGVGTPNPAATSLQGASPASITQTAVDKSNPTFHLGGISITLGGFLDATAITRSASLTAGQSTSYNSIPFNNSPNAHVGEFRMSSQYTRLSFLAQGDPNANLKIAGYVEGDFAGAAVTANSNQTNSYTPRLRQAYTTFDDAADGLHILTGQAYSMATGSTVGITPRKESLPPVIDGNFFPGFTYTRQAEVRIVKDFDKKFWLGLSFENPEEVYSFQTASGSALPNGQTITYSNTGGSFLNSTASYSYDVAPDMIVKAAADTGFGHFEVYGLGRFFRSRTELNGVGNTNTVFGGGVGGSMLVPIFPKKLELVGSALAGDGIGRYTPGQLPDATFDKNGNPVPLPQVSAMVGLVGHPTPAVDLYAYAGEDSIGSSTFVVKTTSKGKTTTTGFGYGTPFASDTFCNTEGGSCGAQTRELADLSFGGWWRVLHGGYGTVQLGLEYSFVKRIAFSGVGGRPVADENIGYVAIRFLPFQ